MFARGKSETEGVRAAKGAHILFLRMRLRQTTLLARSSPRYLDGRADRGTLRAGLCHHGRCACAGGNVEGAELSWPWSIETRAQAKSVNRG